MLERIIGAVTFLVIMAVNFVVSGGLSYIKDLNFGEKIYTVIIFAVSLAVVVGVRGIVAQIRKEEWEMEQERNTSQKE